MIEINDQISFLLVRVFCKINRNLLALKFIPHLCSDSKCDDFLILTFPICLKAIPYSKKRISPYH